MQSKDEKKPASPVSRSVYQKLAEENKRLKADIYTLIMVDLESQEGVNRWCEVNQRWEDKFEKDAELCRLLHEYAVQYFKDHPEKKIPFTDKPNQP